MSDLVYQALCSMKYVTNVKMDVPQWSIMRADRACHRRYRKGPCHQDFLSQISRQSSTSALHLLFVQTVLPPWGKVGLSCYVSGSLAVS